MRCEFAIWSKAFRQQPGANDDALSMADETKSPGPPEDVKAPPLGRTEERPGRKAAPPNKDSVPLPLPWTSPMVEKYRSQYGSGLDAQTYRGQSYLTVD